MMLNIIFYAIKGLWDILPLFYCTGNKECLHLHYCIASGCESQGLDLHVGLSVCAGSLKGDSSPCSLLPCCL